MPNSADTPSKKTQEISTHYYTLAGVIDIHNSMKAGVGLRFVRDLEQGKPTLRLTEHKYRSSYERIAKAFDQYSTLPLLDKVDFMDIVLFSWITGNNDMHLKKSSLYEPQDGRIMLTPAYDMLNVSIINPADDEELALTLNGCKKKLCKNDFLIAGKTMGIETKTIEKLIAKYVKLSPKFHECISSSFLNDKLKTAYSTLLNERLSRIVRD